MRHLVILSLILSLAALIVARHNRPQKTDIAKVVSEAKRQADELVQQAITGRPEVSPWLREILADPNDSDPFNPRMTRIKKDQPEC
jgi:ubiquitin-protein ligase